VIRFRMLDSLRRWAVRHGLPASHAALNLRRQKDPMTWNESANPACSNCTPTRAIDIHIDPQPMAIDGIPSQPQESRI
jgi:hypothetical protein